MSNNTEKKQVEIISPPVYSGDNMPTVTQDNNPAGFVRLAIEKNLDTDKLRELMILEKEWRADQAKAAFDKAMAEFNKIKPVIKHNRRGTTAGNAPFTYSDYPEMVKTVTPLLGQCGLSFEHHRIRVDDGEYEVCKISHESGHSKENEFPILLDMRLKDKISPMQLRQLAVTYAKRQSLAEGLGLATEEDKKDDDAVRSVETITEEQAADLQALCEEVGNGAKAALLKWAKIEQLADLPANKYKQAVKGAEARREK